MNSAKPFFSIITVNLNNKEGLRNTIEHLIDQTFSNYEFIIIDGGSTDGSRDVIQEYQDKIIYWVSEKDRGIYHAMNKGIARANGEYCLFLNSGDYLIGEKVLETIAAGEKKADVLFGNLVVVSGEKVIDRILGKHNITFLDIYNNRVKHQASFIKRSLFDQFGLYNEELKIISDWEFFIKSIGLGGASCYYLDMDIACYDNNGISNINNVNNTSTEERDAIIEKYIPVRMRQDYEFFRSVYRYKRLFKNRSALFIIRAMNRIFNPSGKAEQ